MRGLGQFQIEQMRKGDPRLPQLFRAMRTALDLMEDIATHPQKEPERKPEPPQVTHPARLSAQDKLAYSIKEIRALTGLSNATIYAQIKDGRLRAAKSGGRTLILAQDLQAWIDSWNRRSRPKASSPSI